MAELFKSLLRLAFQQHLSGNTIVNNDFQNLLVLFRLYVCTFLVFLKKGSMKNLTKYKTIQQIIFFNTI